MATPRIVDTFLEPGVASEGWSLGFMTRDKRGRKRFLVRTYADITAGATEEDVVALLTPIVVKDGRDFPTQHSGQSPTVWIARRT